MALYITTKCPYCGATLEARRHTGLNDVELDIGNPVEVCGSCGRPYRTGLTYWAVMSPERRLKVKARLAFGAVMLAVILGVLGILVAAFIGPRDDPQTAAIVGGFFGLLIGGFIGATRSSSLLEPIIKWEPDAEHKDLAARFGE